MRSVAGILASVFTLACMLDNVTTLKAQGTAFTYQGRLAASGTPGAPLARYSHTAVWTGSEMIVWGGQDGGNFWNDTFSYTPGRLMYLYRRP